MNLPNLLTVGRFFLTGGFIYFLNQNSDAGYVWAVIFFFLAMFSDYCDGYLARKYNLFTDFGKIMDPIADKFLILSAFFIFMRWRLIPAWIFYVIAFREVLVTVSRLLLMRKGKTLAAEREGKIKTIFQMAAVCLILAQPLLAVGLEYVRGVPSFVWLGLIKATGLLTPVGLASAVLLTAYSGMKYFWQNKRQLY